MSGWRKALLGALQGMLAHRGVGLNRNFGWVARSRGSNFEDWELFGIQLTVAAFEPAQARRPRARAQVRGGVV